MSEPLLRVTDLKKYFSVKGGLLSREVGRVHAVDGVSFAVNRGETLGLVGESGCGKSTTARCVLRLIEPSEGEIAFDGQDMLGLSGGDLRAMRRNMQIVFQDPFASLNPRMTVRQIVAAPLAIQQPGLDRSERDAKVSEALRTVGLSDQYADRYPHEFSGGQRQRIGIARALIMEPSFLVADEPVSALDVSIQAQIVNLLIEIKRKLDLTILFISHDLAVVGHLCDRVAVMYLGRIVEIAETRALFRQPRHPYTQALFEAVPVPDPTRRRQRIILKGDMPSPITPPSGCAFRTRCRYALPACAEAVPPLRETGGGHMTRCIRDDIDLR